MWDLHPIDWQSQWEMAWNGDIYTLMMHQWMEWGLPFLRNHHLRSSKGVIAKEETLEMTGLSRAFSKKQRPTSNNCLASGGCKVSTRKWPNASDDFYGLWMLVIQSQHIAVFLKWTPNTTRFNTQMVIHDLDDLDDLGKSQNSQLIPTHSNHLKPFSPGTATDSCWKESGLRKLNCRWATWSWTELAGKPVHICHTSGSNGDQMGIKWNDELQTKMRIWHDLTHLTVITNKNWISDRSLLTTG